MHSVHRTIAAVSQTRRKSFSTDLAPKRPSLPEFEIRANATRQAPHLGHTFNRLHCVKAGALELFHTF
jgi:hypothetical protein